MSKLIKLDRRVESRLGRYQDDRYQYTTYGFGAPFFCGPRGILAHRVKGIYMISFRGGDWWPPGRSSDWWVAEFWCGNTGLFHDDDALQFDTCGRLLCERCEGMALAAGKPTATKLAGHHVCVGKLRAVNVCSCSRGEN